MSTRQSITLENLQDISLRNSQGRFDPKVLAKTLRTWALESRLPENLPLNKELLRHPYGWGAPAAANPDSSDLSIEVAWREGVPPATGWWRTAPVPLRSGRPDQVGVSASENAKSKARLEFRYWNGKAWSYAVTPQQDLLARLTNQGCTGNQNIEWADQAAPWGPL